MSKDSDCSDDECWYNEGEEAPVSRLSKDLEDFRENWEAELREKRMGIFRTSTSSKKSNNENPSIALEKAKKLFLLGYSAEKDGKLADAIEYYRAAVLIDPSIEANVRDDLKNFRLAYSKTHSHIREPTDVSNKLEGTEDNAKSDSASTCFVEIETVIHKNHEQLGCHISALPNEVLLYLLRWVIGHQLDVRSIEQISMTCRAFYFLARDTELWRLICLKTFGRTFERSSQLNPSCSTWRDFYIQVPHLHFNGCYISRVVYHRRGDISLDCAYQPWHSVEYYRYFRFFADGTVLTLTTSDDPITSLPKLRSRQSKFVNVIHGIYRVAGSEVTIILEKTSVGEQSRFRPGSGHSSSTTMTYFMGFELRNRRYRSYLNWKSYRVVSRMPGGKESTNDFDCSSDDSTGNHSFPPLFFSRVKSFATVSDAPLA